MPFRKTKSPPLPVDFGSGDPRVGADRGQESSNRLSRNALSAGRPLPTSPRARSFRAKSTPTSTTTPRPVKLGIEIFETGLHLAGFDRRDLLVQILCPIDPAIAGDRLVRVGCPGGFGRRGGLLLVGLEGHDAALHFGRRQ